MAQIAWFVVDDAWGNLTGIVPDRSPTANDGTIQDTGAGGYPYWNTTYGGCPAFANSPTSGNPGGIYAADNAAYTVTDFTLLACSSIGTHSPSVGAGFVGHNPGSGVQRKWAFGSTGLVDANPTGSRSFIHLSDGGSFSTFFSDYWPEQVFTRGSGLPGGGNGEGMYLIGLKRSGNTLSFFLKWGVMRQSDGALVDQNTGDVLAPTLAGADPAVAIGTATSSIQPGDVAAPLVFGGANEEGPFGANLNFVWGAMWDTALADEDILAAMDAAWPVCGTSLESSEIDAELVVNDEAVYQPTIGTSAVLAECSTFVEHVCLILTADWEFGRQVVPIYRNDLIFVNAAQQPLTFVNVNDEVLSFNATGLMLSKSDVAGVYGHYLGWSARGEAAPFRIETVEMEYQSTREWDTSP